MNILLILLLVCMLCIVVFPAHDKKLNKKSKKSSSHSYKATSVRVYNGMKIRKIRDRDRKLNKSEAMVHITNLVDSLYPLGKKELRYATLVNLLANADEDPTLAAESVPLAWLPINCDSLGYRFVTVRSITEHPMTKVWIVKEITTNELFVWKRYGRNGHYAAELSFFMVADHDHIARPLCTLPAVGDQNFPSVVLEIVRGTTTQKYFRNLTTSQIPSEVARLGAQVYDAFKYMHWLGYYHGDIKSENVMVDWNGNAVVIDFGFSNPFPYWSVGKGTHTTISPEAVNYIKGPHLHNMDWFSFGQMLSMWGAGNYRDEKGHLWGAMTLWTDYYELRDFPVRIGSWEVYDMDLRQLLFYFLNPNPSQRLFQTAKQLQWVESLPFWSYINFKEMEARWNPDLTAEVHNLRESVELGNILFDR